MKVEQLDTVLALRRRAVAEARRHLAASTEAATHAANRARELERRIESETAIACDAEGSDHLVEAFAAWLPGARHDVVQARAAQERADAEANRRRAELVGCRTALGSIEALIAHRAALRAETRARGEQRALDEIGQRSPPAPPQD